MIKVLIVASIIFGVVFSFGLTADRIPFAQMADDLQTFLTSPDLSGLDELGLNDPVQDEDAETIISSSSVDFEFDIITVDDPNVERDEHFLNVINTCNFHSDENIDGDTCVVCTLKDSDGESVGSGRVEIPGRYISSTTYPVEIETDFEGQNSVFSVKSVELKICDFEERGCSVLFWNTPTPPAWDQIPVSPDDSFRLAFFGTNDSETFAITVNGDTLENPTLLQALNADADLGGLNQLVPQAVAALLNSQHPGLDFNLTSEQVVIEFYGAFTTPADSTDDETLAALLATHNNLECPLSKPGVG